MTDEHHASAVHLASTQGKDALDRVLAEIDAEDESRKARLAGPLGLTNAAIWYAEQGIPIFPLRVGEKRPATAHGFKDATTDAEAVHTWWAENPAYNIGFATGTLFDVIDIDGPPGYLSLDQLRQEGLVPELIGRSVTPRGTHLYIAPTGDGNTAGLRPGIDYRGIGGYVVAPPSHSAETGKRWTWTHPIELP